MTIETKIKNKERSIRKLNYKIKETELTLIGLEEARVFCDFYKTYIMSSGNSKIKVSTKACMNFKTWPKSVGRERREGHFEYRPLINCYYYDDNNLIDMDINNDGVELFSECYVQMRDELYNELEVKRMKLKALYEDYGKLSFEYKNKIDE